MIVYGDTSAIIKLYITEMDSDKTNDLRTEATLFATCRISWAEPSLHWPGAHANKARMNPL